MQWHSQPRPKSSCHILLASMAYILEKDICLKNMTAFHQLLQKPTFHNDFCMQLLCDQTPLIAASVSVCQRFCLVSLSSNFRYRRNSLNLALLIVALTIGLPHLLLHNWSIDLFRLFVTPTMITRLMNVFSSGKVNKMCLTDFSKRTKFAFFQ